MPGRLKLQYTAVPVLIAVLLAGAALAAIEKAILAGPQRGFVYLGRGGRGLGRPAGGQPALLPERSSCLRRGTRTRAHRLSGPALTVLLFGRF
ncbi:MAG: hypothetical protein M0C28_39515 [Candidatus Moduliflexus flocculans]|nr:hypothetical protein [Candidatus Moduliflexus flocculans]